MQVLIRRQGVSLRAEWDGLAKPSDKQLHYWLRATPDAPMANADGALPVTDVLSAPVISSSGTSPATTQVFRSATVVLFKGVTGLLERPLDAPVLGSTAVTPANAVIINYATGPASHDQVVPALASSYSLNLLSLMRITEFTTTKPVDHRAYKGHEGLRFAGHDFASCYQVADNQVVEAVKFRMNLLNAYVVSGTHKLLESSSVDRQGTVLLKAPLPSGELLQSNELSYDAAPAPTDPTHMELVTQVNDALAHTHWSRTPRPTHFVQESQTPVASAEVVRSDTPVVIVRGGWGDTPVIYDERAHRITNEGPAAVIRPLGSRGVLSLTHTNGLNTSHFSQSTYKAPYKSCYWTYRYGRRDRYICTTKYTDPVFAYEIFSGTNTGSDARQGYYTKTWNGEGTSGAWVQVDFGKLVEGIDGVMLRGSSNDNSMKGVVILSSDNGYSWRTEGTFGMSSRGALDTFDLTPFTARYVRIKNTSNWGGDYTSLRGVEILKRGGGSA